MKKEQIRTLTVLLALLTAAAASVTACGSEAAAPEQKNTAPAETEAAPAETEFSYKADYLPDVDYGGYEYRLVQYEEDPMDVPEETGVIIDDAICRRNRKIEEEYNIRFTAKTYLYTNYPDVKTAFDKSGRSQSDDFDLAMLTFRDAYNTILEGLAPAASVMPMTDLSQPWYIQSINDSLTIDGITLMGYTALECQPGGGGIVFNRKIVQELDMDDPYALVDSGKWTSDVFYKMGVDAIYDVDGDGKFAPGDRFGLITEWDRLSQVAYMGTGHLLVNIIDGVPVASQEELLVTAFTICQEHSNMPGFMLDTFAQFGTAESSRIEGFQLFKQGGSLFIICGSGSLTGFGDMQDDYGIVPYPKWTEDQERFYNPTSGGSLALPLSCSTDLERVCVIKEALAVESLNIVTPAFYDNALKNRYLRDEDSVRMLEIISANGVVDLGQSPWWDIVRVPWQNTLVSKKPNFASAVEKNMKKSQKAIDELMEKVAAIKEEIG